MTPKIYPKNLRTPKILFFLKPQNNIENQNFELQKNDPSLRMHENIRVFLTSIWAKTRAYTRLSENLGHSYTLLFKKGDYHISGGVLCHI